MFGVTVAGVPMLVILGALLELSGCTSFAISTVKGKTRPLRVTWLMFTATTATAFAAAVQAGVGWIALITLAACVGPAAVFVSTFASKASRKASWKISATDVFCGIFSAVGICLWVWTDDPVQAIVCNVLADAIAAFPTIQKAFFHPETQGVLVWVLGALGSALALLSLNEGSVAHVAFPAYIIALNCTILSFRVFKPGERFKKERSSPAH